MIRGPEVPLCGGESQAEDRLSQPRCTGLNGREGGHPGVRSVRLRKG